MRRNGESGAAAVELAIITPLLVLLLFGVIVFGIQLFRLQSVQAAAREGGRLAAIGETYEGIKLRAWQEQHVARTLADLDVTVTRGPTAIEGTNMACGDAHTGEDVTVQVAVVRPEDYKLSIPFFGSVGPDFSSVAVFRCE